MVNAAGILSIRAEDTDLDENVKKRVIFSCPHVQIMYRLSHIIGPTFFLPFSRLLEHVQGDLS